MRDETAKALLHIVETLDKNHPDQEGYLQMRSLLKSGELKSFFDKEELSELETFFEKLKPRKLRSEVGR